MKLEELIKETKGKELKYMIAVNDFAKKHKLTEDLVPNINRSEISEFELDRILDLYGEHGEIFRSFDDEFDLVNFEVEIEDYNKYRFYVEVNALLPWNDNQTEILETVREVDNHYGEEVGKFMTKLVKDAYPNETKPLEVFGSVKVSNEEWNDVDFTEIQTNEGNFMSITYLEWYEVK
jgi:hypothetical protein